MGFLLFLAFGAAMFAFGRVTARGKPAPALQAAIDGIAASLDDRLSETLAAAEHLSAESRRRHTRAARHPRHNDMPPQGV